MQRSIHPVLVILLTTATLSLSDVLPVISVNEAEALPINNDQVYDNTFKAVNNREPEIFYEFLVGPSKNVKTGKPRLRFAGKTLNKGNSNELMNEEDNYDGEGFRKEQWHNYPRQLDRLHKTPQLYIQKGNADLDFEDFKRIKDFDDNDIDQLDGDDITNNNDIDDVAVPLLIFKIRLAFLNNDFQDSNKIEYANLVPLIHDSAKFDRKYESIYTNKIESTANSRSDKQKRIRTKDMAFERDIDEKKTVNKRIFSLWSRLQGLTHKGHELQHRRHLYTFYGLPDDGSNTLTAETRATLIRPPGSPLRWG